MAFPPDIPDDQWVEGVVVREVIKDQPFFGLCQNSAHLLNFMFTDPVLLGDEHLPKVPMVKVMLYFACIWWPADDLRRLEDEFAYEYEYTDVNGVAKSVLTLAPGVLRRSDFIDPQLRDMLMRLLAPISSLPSLADVLAETEAAVVNKGPDDPSLHGDMAGDFDESDKGIQDLVQRFIYNPK
ncbi:hypothetical protein F4808DRAFT_462482 [Astrocystis sublimbata]|nr:hypothetical protein F4808DRAFT_462482 [Astrocystis sublimbata]